jgi:hypothetical protein
MISRTGKLLLIVCAVVLCYGILQIGTRVMEARTRAGDNEERIRLFVSVSQAMDDVARNLNHYRGTFGEYPLELSAAVDLQTPWPHPLIETGPCQFTTAEAGRHRTELFYLAREHPSFILVCFIISHSRDVSAIAVTRSGDASRHDMAGELDGLRREVYEALSTGGSIKDGG